MPTTDRFGNQIDDPIQGSGPRLHVNAQGQETDAAGNVVNPGAYDSEGYPLPDGANKANFEHLWRTSNNWDSGINWGSVTDAAFDPTAPPPEDPSKNPFTQQGKTPGGTQGYQYRAWLQKQKDLAENQRRKQAWQAQNKDKRRAPIQDAGPSGPAFQSSGVDLTKQGKGENYIDSILGHYEKEGAPETTNYSAAALADFQAQQPKDMSAYYDNASRKSANAINTQMAARGSYGSSNAIGTLGAAETDLRAQQARDEAGYGLQRFGMQNTLSGAADSQNNNRSANQLLWAKGLADLATQDQGMGENRNQTLWGNNLALAGIKSATYGAGANAAIDDVTAANDASNNATMGVATDAQSNAAGNANRSAQTNSSILNSATQAAGNTYNYYKKPGSS